MLFSEKISLKKTQITYLIRGGIDFSSILETEIKSNFSNKELSRILILKEKHELFGIEEARNLSSLVNNKKSGSEKVFFIIEFNRITREAQNALLKLTEELKMNNIIFFLTPKVIELLATIESRIVELNIKSGSKISNDSLKKDADAFLEMTTREKMDFVNKYTDKKKKIVWEKDKWLLFLAELEIRIHAKKKTTKTFVRQIKTIYLAKKLLLSRGAMNKMIMEHVSLSI